MITNHCEAETGTSPTPFTWAPEDELQLLREMVKQGDLASLEEVAPRDLNAARCELARQHHLRTLQMAGGLLARERFKRSGFSTSAQLIGDLLEQRLLRQAAEVAASLSQWASTVLSSGARPKGW